MLLLLLGSVGVGLWCLAIACGLGCGFASRLLPRAAASIRLSAAFLIGTALLSYAVLALGLAAALRALPLLTLLALLTIPLAMQLTALSVLLRAAVAELRDAAREASRPLQVLVWAVAGVTALGVFAPLLPVTNADALAYATATPARYALDSAMRFYPDSYESAFALLIEQLHAIGYVFGLRPVGAWFELATQCLLWGAALACYRAFWGDERRGSGLMFGVALLAAPLTQLMPFMVKAHLVELLAIVVVITVLFDAPTDGGWLGAAACSGVCVATKYNAGLGLVTMVAPIALVAFWRARTQLRLNDAVGMIALGLLFGLPLYLRNWWWTGDPLFPMHVAGFRSSFHLQHQDDWIASLYYLDSGFGRQPIDLLLWWVRAAILPVRRSASYMGSFALSFLPLAFTRPRAPHTVVVTIGFVLSTIALFVAGSQFERYFLAPIVAMTLLAVAGWDAWRPMSRWIDLAGIALLLGLAVLITLPQKAYMLYVQAPALVSRAGEARVLDLTTPFHDDFVRIYESVPGNAPVLCLLRNCQYLVNYRREDALFRLTEDNQAPTGAIDPRPVHAGLLAQQLRYLVAYEESPDADTRSVVDWLARCGGHVSYRNLHARFGTRDPRNVRYGAVRLIELSDTLSADGAALSGECVMPTRSW